MKEQNIIEKDLKLTQREVEVLEYLTSGYSNREIGDRMSLSVSTIKTHLESIYLKLGLSNRVSVSIWAVLEAGIIPKERKY